MVKYLQDSNNNYVTNYYHLQHIIHEQTIVHRYHDVFAISVLEICHIELDDAGEYLCTMTEGNCTVSATKSIWFIVEPGNM